MEIEPNKECSTCSLLCMRIDTIVEKAEKQERTLEDLQKRLLSMEIRISTTVSIAVGIVTILANYLSR